MLGVILKLIPPDQRMLAGFVALTVALGLSFNAGLRVKQWQWDASLKEQADANLDQANRNAATDVTARDNADTVHRSELDAAARRIRALQKELADARAADPQVDACMSVVLPDAVIDRLP